MKNRIIKPIALLACFLATVVPWVPALAENQGDVTGDNKVGMAEAIHALQVVAGMSPAVINAAPAPLAVTGQTVSLVNGDDGYHEAGIPRPATRFVDNGDGTVTDNLTGLIWLQNADCTTCYSGDPASTNARTWDAAVTSAHNLANGFCGLSDGSAAGDWRLPNILELLSIVDFGSTSPFDTFADPYGTDGSTRLFTGPNGVNHNLFNVKWWSGTYFGANNLAAWYVDMSAITEISADLRASNSFHVWPVRNP